MAGISDIAKAGGVKYEDVSKTIEGIRKLLRQGEKITLQEFGTFEIDVQDERKGRNPHTGEPVDVPAKSIPKFRFNYTFRNSIAEAVKVDNDKLNKKRERKQKYFEKLENKEKNEKDKSNKSKGNGKDKKSK